MKLTLEQLKDSGYVLQADGSYAKRRDPVGGVAPDRAERPPVRPLVQSVQKPAGGKAGVVCRVTCVTLRKRLLDGHDAVAYSCKPLTDAIAESLGVDDADPRLHWSYHQLKTDGPEGVAVLISVQ